MSEKIYNMVDLETIEKLADIVSAKENGKYSLMGQNADEYPQAPALGANAVHVTMGAPVMPAVPAAASAAPAETPAAPKAPAGKAIKAPLVGTFYAAPSPDQPPFVQVGDTVKKGDVVLIIESMKLMNEVTSDVEGVVQEILVKNGDAVEYDQPLMILA